MEEGGVSVIRNLLKDAQLCVSTVLPHHDSRFMFHDL
jgi:hypothetical protein